MPLDLTRLRAHMASHGVVRLYVKKLAPNDNSKNQVYFGPGFEAIHVIPNKSIDAAESGGRTILKAALDMAWMDDSGSLHHAACAQMILYPQYPEVRLSGFLRGCRGAPSQIMASRERGRLLFLGVGSDGHVVAYAACADSPTARELDELGELPSVGVFHDVGMGAVGGKPSSRELLIAQLRRIHLLGWINSKRLRPDGSLDCCNSSNCGGYTLEAELGVIPNGFAEPDFMGWEVKQHGVRDFSRPEQGSSVTLMTPEPTGGYYRDAGVESFIRRFGYSDRRGRPDRLNVGGIYRCGTRVSSTGLTLILDGYDKERNVIVDISRGVTLLSETGEIAALWHYTSLIGHWTRKHDRAAYVPSECRTTPSRQYRFGRLVSLGEGADFLLVLAAIARGDLYYDPGIKLERGSASRPLVKRRSQFRIKWRNLRSIYRSMEVIDVLGGERTEVQ